MKLFRPFLTWATVLVATHVHAGYQYQADVDYTKVNAADTDVHATSMQLHWFVDPLLHGDEEPWAEAAFLQRSRNFSVALDHNSLQLDGRPSDANSWSLGTEYMSQGHNVYAAGTISMLNGDNSLAGQAAVGYFLAKNWLVKADVYHHNMAGQTAQTDYGVSTKLIVPVLGGDYVVLNAAIANFEQGAAHNLSADYYMRPWWSVGVALREAAPGWQQLGDATEIRSEYYLWNRLALRGAFARVDVGNETDNQYSVGASLRF